MLNGHHGLEKALLIGPRFEFLVWSRYLRIAVELDRFALGIDFGGQKKARSAEIPLWHQAHLTQQVDRPSELLRDMAIADVLANYRVVLAFHHGIVVAAAREILSPRSTGLGKAWPLGD